MITEKEITIEETTDANSNWFDAYDKPRETKDLLPIFKMDLGEGQLSRKEEIIFLDCGHKGDTKFGEAIKFLINSNKKDYVWFIKENQYALLNPIAKELKKGNFEGRVAVVERIGLKKETRWVITFK